MKCPFCEHDARLVDPDTEQWACSYCDSLGNKINGPVQSDKFRAMKTAQNAHWLALQVAAMQYLASATRAADMADAALAEAIKRGRV